MAAVTRTDDDPERSNGGRSGDSGAEQSVDRDDLGYLTLTPLGLSRIDVESGDEDQLLSFPRSGGHAGAVYIAEVG